MKTKPTTKYDTLHYLLGQFGDDRMTRAEFWKEMNARGYTQDDIDSWCEQYHELNRRKDDEREKDRAARGAAARNARGEGGG
jgi:hypothetical protein